MKFTPVPQGMLQKAESIYWEMIWDGKRTGLIRRHEAITSNLKGGLGCRDLQNMIGAITIKTIARARTEPIPSWATLGSYMLRNTQVRTLSVRQNRFIDPWVQTVAARPPKPPPSLHHILSIWRGFLKKALEDTGPLCFGQPNTKADYNSIKFWYHPQIKSGQGVGARRFASKAWTQISDANASTMGDLEEILQNNQNWTTSEWNNIKRTITSLLDDIPSSWINARNSTKINHTNTAGQILLNMVKPTSIGTFSMCYSACKKFNRINTPARPPLLREALQEVRNLTGHITSEKQFWACLWNISLTPKTCDFVWRLVHNLVRVGEDLGWLPEDKKSCPYCRARLNISHILIQCPGCIPVWTRLGHIGTKLGQTFTIQPKSIAQLIALICADPGDIPNARGRGQLLTSIIVWSLWKNHLRWSIDGYNGATTPENTIGLAIKQLTSCFHRDRVISMTYRYTGHKITTAQFRHFWGMEPWTVSTVQPPWFLID
ncbi:BgtA-20381 [Blumeria graminis f. sp. tritici]|uniref:BgtA-20381 n=2 Tax=Blumeria graminis f. sp. tritici TaxID=62690 RepID=A0A9X9MNE9_BLUGR|nr:hypothetical protein BGT96224_A20381 [Blumeria graminis f. sp. tritici 96224]VDB93768.1 BgtA-20381 [Blumeria graminis f. sp. tritici]